MIQRAFFVVNPRSGAGETGRRWDRILTEKVLPQFPQVRWAFTEAQGHGSRLASMAREEGAELVVAVGGDGTVNEVVNGLMGVSVEGPSGIRERIEGASWPEIPESQEEKSADTRPILGLLPRGTGGDFSRSIGMPKDVDQALALLAAGPATTVDVGQLEFIDHRGENARRYFINIAGCGANGEVVDRVNKSGKRLGGFLSFLLATLATTARFHSPSVRISLDDEAPRALDLNVLFVCNAQYCGGGMRVGKDARINDGIFKVVEIEASSRLKSLMHGSRLYSGAMEDIPFAHIRNARKIHVDSSAEVLLDCDGEQPGKLPATFTLLDKQLRVRTAPGAMSVS